MFSLIVAFFVSLPFHAVITAQDCLSDEISLHTSKEIDAAFHIQGEDHLESGSKARRERKNTVMWYTSATSGEHRLKTISYTTGTHQSPVNNWVYVDLAFSLHVERDITYYVNKVKGVRSV